MVKFFIRNSEIVIVLLKSQLLINNIKSYFIFFLENLNRDCLFFKILLSCLLFFYGDFCANLILNRLTIHQIKSTKQFFLPEVGKLIFSC